MDGLVEVKGEAKELVAGVVAPKGVVEVEGAPNTLDAGVEAAVLNPNPVVDGVVVAVVPDANELAKGDEKVGVERVVDAPPKREGVGVAGVAPNPPKEGVADGVVVVEVRGLLAAPNGLADGVEAEKEKGLAAVEGAALPKGVGVDGVNGPNEVLINKETIHNNNFRGIITASRYMKHTCRWLSKNRSSSTSILLSSLVILPS